MRTRLAGSQSRPGRMIKERTIEIANKTETNARGPGHRPPVYNAYGSVMPGVRVNAHVVFGCSTIMVHDYGLITGRRETSGPEINAIIGGRLRANYNNTACACICVHRIAGVCVQRDSNSRCTSTGAVYYNVIQVYACISTRAAVTGARKFKLDIER